MKLVPLSEFGDLMAIDEFISGVEEFCFIDYDGYGYWATETEMDNEFIVRPSEVASKKTIPPDWATHIFWFNR